MIVTTIDKLGDYKEIPCTEEIMKFVEDFKKTDMQTGRYDIHGDDLFVAVSRYDTEPAEDRKFESHRKYIDLQILFEGEEEIHWAPVGSLTMTEEEFSKGGDIAFFEGESKGYTLLKGDACTVLFPDDAHKPNCSHGENCSVLKGVFKISASL